MIDRQATHITRLVDDLLDVGRLNTGKIKLRLINAAKYTREGGRIVIGAALSDGFVNVSVSDNGRGIAPQDLERIFQLFAQAEEIGSAPNDSGLGIGLTLARSLVEMHGGALEAQSEGPGRGSRFRFWLPRAGTAAEDPRDEAEPADAPQQLRVLVVDDNRDAADSTTVILRLLGHRTESSYDGVRALEIAERFKPHLVLLDLAMPGMDGFQTYDQSCEPGKARTPGHAAFRGRQAQPLGRDAAGRTDTTRARAIG